MPLLQPLGQGQGYLKAGFLGFSKSGKTYTATDLAIGTYKFFANCGDIVFFDTEGGSEYVAARIKEQIGKLPLGLKSRSFADLMKVTKELKPNDVLLVDSVTHVWRELCDSHLMRVNEALARKNKPPRFKLEFQDWNPIKATWENWTTWYLNSPVHVIICGRAGWEYDMQTTEDVSGNERKELVKIGTKMKTESEFGFEPSLLVEMERLVEHANGRRRVTKRQATVIGDRFGILDGKTFVNPKFKDFEPHLKRLKPGALNPIDTATKSDTGVTEEGDIEWQRERKARTILSEEIQGLLVFHIPGQTAKDKQRKAALLHEAFGTRSWTAVEGLPSEVQRQGLSLLHERLDGAPRQQPGSEEFADSEVTLEDVPA
ncbi:MAG TPA: AAA family ATPase [Bryobacteraceae bacterium]|jgi:hypothetical protein